MLGKTLLNAAIFALALPAATLAPAPAKAQSEPMIGQLMAVGFNFCPRGWAEANGALLAISQYSALFSLLGTQYGGDGRTTFGLPDLRGRAPVGAGTGIGLNAVSMGQQWGRETVTLTMAEMPEHTHTMNGVYKQGEAAANGNGIPPGSVYAREGDQAVVQLHPQTIHPAGGSRPVDISAPRLGIMWCIALEGFFPSRN